MLWKLRQGIVDDVRSEAARAEGVGQQPLLGSGFRGLGFGGGGVGISAIRA